MSTAAELSNAGDSSSELRERKKFISPDWGSDGVSTGSSQEEKPKDGQETWGRTPDGTGMYIPVNNS
jgi:ribosomal protein S19E (S16A)